MKKQDLIPSGISALRIAALPLLFYFFNIGALTLCFVTFACFAFTDLFDGFVARKLKAASKFGAYFDAFTDFIFVTAIFSLFVLSGYYSSWMLILIAASFMQFVVSSLYTKKLYDPLGKYLGSALYLGIGLTLAFPIQPIFVFVQYAFLIFASISFITRTVSLASMHKKNLPVSERKLLNSSKTQTITNKRQ